MATKKSKSKLPATEKSKTKLPPLIKFDWKKELRANGFKVSRDNKITKQVLNQPKGRTYTEKVLLRRQAKYNIPAYKTKKYTKTQALNVIARETGYKDIKTFFKARKTDKYRVFARYARDAKKPTELGSEFARKYKTYSDTGFASGEAETDLLEEVDMIGPEDYDKYIED